jgi:hypothetical protein
MVNQQQQSNFQLRQNQKNEEDENLGEPKKCVHCGNATAPNADICERCGVWQLGGQCCFCYAPVQQGQSFCGNCGNAPEGKPCPNCGTHSIFDLCPKCEFPVSKRAPAYLNQIKSMPEVVEILQQINALDELKGNATSAVSTTPDWLTQLSNYEKQFNTKPDTTKQQVKNISNFAFKSESKDVSENIDAATQSKTAGNITDAIDNQRAELKRKIAELQNRAFSSNQEARAFSTCIAIALPRIRETTIPGTRGVWQCNFAGVTHSSPTDCACAGMGGKWIDGNPEEVIVDTVYDNI